MNRRATPVLRTNLDQVPTRSPIRPSRAWKVATLWLLASLMADPSFAEFPEKRIQLVYPLTTGTPTYRVSQIIANAMSMELGVQMIAAAKPGASGADALMAALREPADGYTVIDGYVAPLIISPLFGKVPYTCADFIPLYSATATPLAVVSRAGEKRWTDFPSFIRFLKENPGKTRYSAGGELSMPHLVSAKLLRTVGAVSRHITFADLHEGAVELRDGTLDWMIVNPGMFQDAKGSITVLGVISDSHEPVALYGDAKPTVDFGITIGLAGLASKPWDWWLVKKGTPDAIVEKLRAAMAKALARPEIEAQLSSLGYLPTRLKPEQFQRHCEQISTDLRGAMGAIDWEKAEIKKLK